MVQNNKDIGERVEKAFKKFGENLGKLTRRGVEGAQEGVDYVKKEIKEKGVKGAATEAGAAIKHGYTAARTTIESKVAGIQADIKQNAYGEDGQFDGEKAKAYFLGIAKNTSVAAFEKTAAAYRAGTDKISEEMREHVLASQDDLKSKYGKIGTKRSDARLQLKPYVEQVKSFAAQADLDIPNNVKGIPDCCC